MSSEIAQFRQQLEAETRAMKQGLDGLASTAKHEIIANRHKSLDALHNELTAIVGPAKAIEIVYEVYSMVVE